MKRYDIYKESGVQWLDPRLECDTDELLDEIMK